MANVKDIPELIPPNIKSISHLKQLLNEFMPQPTSGKKRVKFDVSGAPVSKSPDNKSFEVTVKVVDEENILVSDYTGQVHFSGTDSNMPKGHLFVEEDGGICYFTIIFKKADNNFINVSEAIDPEDDVLQYRRLLEDGFNTVKDRITYNEALAENDVKSFNVDDMHFWIDDMISGKLNGKREGMKIAWDINGAKVLWDPITGKFDES